MWAVVNAYKKIMGKEPPREMTYHLTAISRYLGIEMDEEEFEEMRKDYGPTLAPKCKGTST